MPSVDLVGGALTSAGFSYIEKAGSIHEAIAVIPKLQPDLTVLHMMEPQTFESYRRLIGRLRGAPVLAIVAEEQMAQAFDAGVDDCLARPVRTTELASRARAALRLRIERVRRIRRDRRLSEEMRALQDEKHELERIACVDSLTGVANRRHALTLLDAEWKRSVREATPLSLVIVDLDHFHAYNEAYGHPGGDACLRKVTAEIATCLRRPSDFVGRYGGEEFIAVLANTDAIGARIVAERVRSAVERLGIPHATSSSSSVVTISVGFATMLPKHENGSDLLIKAADTALLRAKAQGRNRIEGEAPEVPARPRTSSHPWRRFPAVVLDPWFADRIPTFLSTTTNEIVVLREALELGSLDRIRGIARRLRGNATDHNIPTIVELANLLERAARADDRDGLKGVIDELAQYVEHVVVQYRRPAERKLDHAG